MLIGWKYLEYPIVYIIPSNIYLCYTKSVLIRTRLFWGEFHPSYLQGYNEYLIRLNTKYAVDNSYSVIFFIFWHFFHYSLYMIRIYTRFFGYVLDLEWTQQVL